MPRILVTAFEAYAGWSTNASWLALIELTRALAGEVDVTTRLYPVNLTAMQEKLAVDLAGDYDFALHVGQAPQASWIQLEEVALNVVTAGSSVVDAQGAMPICEEGPAAYPCQLPVRSYARRLREAGIPACASFHAGTYLCNAILYWSCHLAHQRDLRTRATFVHVPLATEQVVSLDAPVPFMPSSMVADALLLLLKMVSQEVSQPLA